MKKPRAASPETAPVAGKAVNEWITKIEQWQRAPAFEAWDKACDVIRKLYRYEASATAKTRRYQLLWSNMETMRGATYAKPPHAEVLRRYHDKDDTARQATMMMERCINFTLDAHDYDATFKQVRDDYLLYARGVARLVYEPVMEAVALADDGLDGAAVEGADAETSYLDDEAEAVAEPPAQEILKFEQVKIKYVHRADFVHEPARTWEEVNAVAFRSFLDRKELVERFGEDVGNAIPLDSTGENRDDLRGAPANNDAKPKATIWEIWDKAGQRVKWVAVAYPEVLDDTNPYLKFDGFFPMPRPAYGTLTNDTLAPRPDYIYYQDQAEEINSLTARIASLQDSLKIVGFYPGGPKGEGTPEVERAVKPGVENKMIAVYGWENFTTKGGGKAPVIFLPVAEVAQVLEGCVKLRQQLIDDVNQIYGIADIMRGDSNANETAKAQGIKSFYGSLRIRSRQGELARFCRDICRMVGEVICNHFQPETIMAMSNQPLPTDAEVLMQIQQQAQQQAMQAAQAQQSAMMGHNGGPPMGGPPAPPQGAPMPAPMGMAR